MEKEIQTTDGILERVHLNGMSKIFSNAVSLESGKYHNERYEQKNRPSE